MLVRCCCQAAIRIASLDEYHPLARLARARASTRLTLRHRELPRTPTPRHTHPAAGLPTTEAAGTQECPAHSCRQVAHRPNPVLRPAGFLRRAKLQDGSTGAAAALYIAGLELLTVSTHLGKMMEVYDAELIGALIGLKAALQSPVAAFAENVIVMLDNQEAAYRLLVGQPTLTLQDIILDFHATADRWPLRTRNSMSPSPGRPTRRQAEVAEPRLRLGSSQVLLGTPKGAVLFARFLGASNFLTRYAVPVHIHPNESLPVTGLAERPQSPTP
ncbi:uncharacterized protein BROUX77_007019 [Berkeleyomyces rouxiae]|uniref:uncharacterized protein n=1 Tax=Berkeleyomyces rouxiae TaxID=2035830 RepID=UPI003B82C35F